MKSWVDAIPHKKFSYWTGLNKIAEIGIINNIILGKVFRKSKNNKKEEKETRDHPNIIRYNGFQENNKIFAVSSRLGKITICPLYITNRSNSQKDSSSNTIFAKETKCHSSVRGIFTL